MLTVLIALALPFLSPLADALPSPKAAAIAAEAPGSLTLETRLERSRVNVTSGTAHVLVRLTAAEAGDAARRPVDLALVLDRSGSMAGRKIEDARAAALAMIERLADGDRVVVVSYGTDVRVDVPPTVLDASTRLDVTRAVVRIRHGGRTHLAGGLRVAYHQLESVRDDARARRVVLVSDGLANVGTRDPRQLAGLARADWQRGVATTTLGLGADYNEDLMTELAVHGGGAFYHVGRSADLAGVLAEELAHLQATVARQATLELTVPEGVRVAAVHGHAFQQEGRTVIVTLGDFAAGQSRSIVWSLALPVGGFGQQALGQMALHYSDARDGQRRAARGPALAVTWTSDHSAAEASVDPEVAARLAELHLADAMNRAAVLLAAGEAEEAEKTLGAATRAARAGAARFGAAAGGLGTEAAAAEVMLDRLQAAPAASPEARRELVKENKAKAFSLNRQ